MYILLIDTKIVTVYDKQENGDLHFIEDYRIDEISLEGLQEYYGAKEFKINENETFSTNS